MKTMASSEVKTHLLRLLDEVERGETILITRRGAPIARLIGETSAQTLDAETAAEDIRRSGRQRGRIEVAELLDWRDGGRRI